MLEADVIAHVRDASHAESDAQKADVLKVLDELGIEAGTDRPFVEILNKIDLSGGGCARGAAHRQCAARWTDRSFGGDGRWAGQAADAL